MVTYKSYTLGLILSVLLTLAAYVLVVYRLLPREVLIIAIMTLAVIQLWVQLMMFLHLGQESGPRWKLVSWLSTAGVLLIVVIGSLWIMNNLSYHVPTAEDVMHEENIYR